MIDRSRREGGEKPSLLLVDDDATLCDTLGRALAKRGFDVNTALTEEAACKLATESPPEYAVVDLRLPDRSVVLTGYGNIATAIEAIKLGATYYLCKPANADEIVAGFYHDAGDDAVPAKEKPMSIGRLEWEHIWQVLRDHKGNISQAARALSMHRRTLQRKLAKRPVRT